MLGHISLHWLSFLVGPETKNFADVGILGCENLMTINERGKENKRNVTLEVVVLELGSRMGISIVYGR